MTPVTRQQTRKHLEEAKPTEIKHTFIYFPKLPLELREQIWLYVCANYPGRIYKVGEINDPNASERPLTWCNSQWRRYPRAELATLLKTSRHCPVKFLNPGLFLACRESRYIQRRVTSGLLEVLGSATWKPRKPAAAKKSTKNKLVFRHCLSHGITFDFDKDILLMSDLRAMEEFLASAKRVQKELRPVRIVALSTTDIFESFQDMQQIRHRPKGPSYEVLASIVYEAMRFKSLKVLILLWPETGPDLGVHAEWVEKHIQSLQRETPRVVSLLESELLGHCA